MGDPSGAARAPQTTLDEVREALAEYGRALLYWDDLPGKCTEDEAHAISTHIKKHAPRWLGALVQAVEDQQRALDDFAHAAHAVLEGDSYVGTTPEMVAANRRRLAVLAGKYDLPVSSGDAP